MKLKSRIKTCIDEEKISITNGYDVYTKMCSLSYKKAIEFKNAFYWLRTTLFIAFETIVFAISCISWLILLPFDLLFYITRK